jgi:hypothetical protein
MAILAASRKCATKRRKNLFRIKRDTRREPRHFEPIRQVLEIPRFYPT